MKLIVCSKREASNFESDVSWCAIQVKTFESEPHAKISGVKRVDLLQLNFPDADSIEFTSSSLSEDEINELKKNMFSDKHADQVIDFYLNNKDKCDVLMVHCLAGRCRSPAIAASLSKIETGEDSLYFKNYTPNSHVYNTILSRAFERGLLDKVFDKKEIKGTFNF